MKLLGFVVKQPGKNDELIQIHASKVTVGSGAHCDIRLPLEAASWEQFVVTQEGDGIVGRAISKDRPTVFDDSREREVALAEGSIVTVDTIQIVLQSVSVADDAARKRKPTPMRKLALVMSIGIVFAGLFVLKTATARNAVAQPPVPSPLRAPITECFERDDAHALAEQKLELARSKRQRFQFYAHDGVDAVALFETAAACMTASGDKAGADQATKQAAEMRRIIEDDFRASRVRLDRALVREDARTALAQVKFERELLYGREDCEDYIAWLAVLQSKLEAMISSE